MTDEEVFQKIIAKNLRKLSDKIENGDVVVKKVDKGYAPSMNNGNLSLSFLSKSDPFNTVSD